MKMDVEILKPISMNLKRFSEQYIILASLYLLDNDNDLTKYHSTLTG